jgi:phage terminase large subunit-like protein
LPNSSVRDASRRKGTETPRLFTRPLRKLTRHTSHGFNVIDFAAQFLGLALYPWQKWLLIHALELNEDGTYRFRKVVMLVGRQNGKSTLLMVLTLWWLYVDSDSFPDHLPVSQFLVLGTAQNLDLAEEVWDRTVALCDPEDDNEVDRIAIPALAELAIKPVRTNGKKALRLRSGARYEVRAANRKGGRGKAAARIVMDELREQQNWDAWGAVSKTMNATFNSQLWGISNAGDAKSVVLAHLRTQQIAVLEQWMADVETGQMTPEDFALEHDMTFGLFEWSAPEGCEIDDPDAILQANPSLGWGAMRWETIWSDLANDPESIFRTEVLCQWVTALVDTYIDSRGWSDCLDPVSAPSPSSSLVLGVDAAASRAYSYVAIAGYREDGLMHVEAIAQRAGMLWLPGYVAEVAARQGITHVAIQTRGCPASEFVAPLREAGLELLEISGPALGAAAGKMRDRVRDRSVRHRSQPLLDVAVSGAVTRRLGEVRIWDRTESVVDIAPLVAVANAAYGLEILPEPEPIRSAYEEHDLLVV